MTYPLSDGSGYAVVDDRQRPFSSPAILMKATKDDGRLTPASYVFIPKDTPGVTMASIHGATISDSVNPMVVTPTALQATGNFHDRGAKTWASSVCQFLDKTPDFRKLYC